MYGSCCTAVELVPSGRRRTTYFGRGNYGDTGAPLSIDLRKRNKNRAMSSNVSKPQKRPKKRRKVMATHVEDSANLLKYL